MTEQTIADGNVPNPGRVYDYLLGGHHNFEVDRQAGDQVKELLPFLPTAMRLSRWCLQDVARELTEKRGFDMVIDFASGLPTVDHIHTAVTPGTTVIYSDYDTVTVEYGREILGDLPNVYYFEADARWPKALLNRAEVQDILADRRRVAFIYWGVSMYLSDQDIRQIASDLYDWSEESSCLAFYVQVINPDAPDMAKTIELYRQMGSEIYARSLEGFQEAIKPWSADELGYRAMEDWHGVEVAMSQEDLSGFSGGGGGYGVYLLK